MQTQLMINDFKNIYTYFYNTAVIIRNRTKTSWLKQFKLLIFYWQLILANIFDVDLKYAEFDGLKFSFINLKSFLNLFSERFIRQEYFFKTENKKPVIIDGGANIGDATLYFKYFYPEAKILAFEPDRETFKILKTNTSHLKNIKLFNQALFDKNTKINFYSDSIGGGNNSLVLERTSGIKQLVKAVKLSAFIKSEVDLLKLDIEGAETIVISELDKCKKLKFVKELYIEYHHHITNSKDELSKILGVLEKNNFKYQLATGLQYPFSKNIFQDILIYAYVNR